LAAEGEREVMVTWINTEPRYVRLSFADDIALALALGKHELGDEDKLRGS
jgi:hypothetical protein